MDAAFPRSISGLGGCSIVRGGFLRRLSYTLFPGQLFQHLVLQLNVFVYAVQLPGVENSLADTLSRFRWGRFWELAPAVEQRRVPCPEWLWRIALE